VRAAAQDMVAVVHSHCSLGAHWVRRARLIMFSFTFHLRQLISELASCMNSLPYLAASCARIASSSGKSCSAVCQPHGRVYHTVKEGSLPWRQEQVLHT